MSSVDNRIVRMSFDNAKFTQAATSTMNTMKKLSESLKLAEGAKGLSNLASKVKSVDMSGLASSVDTVKSRFSALDVVGVTALVNIANSAVNAGKNLVKSLTIDPVKMGFDEYETKMNAITTIMTNTAHAGTTMDQVTATLGDLNEYADKTIYNFAEMTRNIGTFTAAGIGLEDSAIAIKGIANLAAASGSSSQQASTAMYQLSQALASGTVKLQDWNSVVNAGMGGKLFQDALEETAKKLGKGRDMSVSFRDSLQDGWLTSEVLIKTLKDFSIDETMLNAATQVKTFTQLLDTMKESVQSGWAQSWEMIFGNKDEATEFFTAVSDGFNSIMGPMADYRNEALKFWKDNGGREAVINGLSNAAAMFGKVLGPVYQAFKKVIDPWNGERLVSLSKAFENLTKKLIPSERMSQAIGKTFEFLFSTVKLLLSPLKLLGGVFNAILTITAPIVDAFVRIIGVFTKYFGIATEAVNQSNWLDAALKFLAAGAEKVATALDFVLKNVDLVFDKVLVKGAEYVGKFSKKFGEMVVVGKEKVSQAAEYIQQWLEVHKPIEKAGEFVKNALETIQNAIQSFLNFTKSAIKQIRDFFGSIVDKVKESDIQGIDLVNAGLFATGIIVIKKFIGFVKDVLLAFGSFKSSTIGVLDELKGALEAYQKDVSADLLKKVAIGIGILAVSLFILSKIDPNRLIPAVGAMAAALAIMVVGVKQFDKIDPKELKETSSMVIAMIGIATSLNILASAMVKLSALNWEEILKATVGLGAACLAIFAMTKSLDKAKINAGQGMALIAMATSMVILSGAMAIIGNLDITTIQKSLIAMGGVVVGLSAFLNSLRGVTNAGSVGLSLIPITTSLVILGGALAILGNLDISTITQGLLVITAALLQMSLFVNSTRGLTTNLASMGVGVTLLSGALIIFAGAVALFGNMSLGTIAQGLLTIGGSLLILAQTLKMMPKNTVVLASGLLILSTALIVFGGAIAIIGNLNLSTIAKGLGALAGVLLIFAGASYLLAPAIPFMGGLALGLLALGGASLVVGGALMLVATGMTMFSGALMAASGSILLTLGGIALAIPVFASSIALALVSFVTIIGYNAKALGRAFTQLLSNFLQVLIDNIPLAIEAITMFIMGILESIIQLAPVIAQALANLITSLKEVLVSLITNILQTIIELAPVLVQTLVVVITSALEAIRQTIPQIAAVLMEVVVSIVSTLSTELPRIAGLVVEFLSNLIITVLTKMETSIPQIAQKIVDLISAILRAIGDGVPQIVEAMLDLVVRMINGFANAISTKMPEIRSAIKKVISTILTELKNCIKDMVSVGSDIIGGVVRGIKSGISKVTEAARNVARSALDSAKNFLGIHSPSREFAELGKWSSIGMANGISDYGSDVEKEAVGVGENALNGMRAAMSNVSDILNSESDMNPTIKPVLDLTDVQNGARSINGMMGNGYSVKASIDASRATAGNINSRLTEKFNQAQPVASTTNNSSSITNHFTINGTNARDIADEISRIIQQQVERRDVLWA